MGAMRRLSWCSLLNQVWKASQVEMQGQYSIERLYHLKSYCEHTPVLRCFTVLLATPLPCLVVTLALECIPLRDPRLGVDFAFTFFVRGFIMMAIIGSSTVLQCRLLIPTLPGQSALMVVVIGITGLVGVSYIYVLAHAIGFPVPFTILMGSPVATSAFGLCLYRVWATFLRTHPSERKDLFHFAIVVAIQVLVTFLYPAYAFAFVRIPTDFQVPFAFLLPVLKRTIKSTIGYIFQHKNDIQSDMVVLNADIYHVLFVSWCMNGSRSTFNTVLFVAMDLLESALAVLHVRGIVKELTEILKQCSELGRENQIDQEDCHGKQMIFSLPDVALAIWEHDKVNKVAHPRVRALSDLRPSITKPGVSIVPMSLNPQPDKEEFQYAQLVGPGHPLNSIAPDRMNSGRKTSVVRFAQLSTTIPDSTRAAVASMSVEQRQHCLCLVLQLLHVAEFLVLVEFVEVIVPAVYCAYLAGTYHLPNRLYFDSLRDLSPEQLHDQLASIAVYSLLELGSFVLLALVLRRQLGLAPLLQLAFMLETQWQMAQAKLVLWVVFAVQSRLQHFGVDFTFRFQWLHSA